MKYEQPPLPYSSDALEPVISQDTINCHYGKHEKTYIDNLNNLLQGSKYEEMSLEDVIRFSEGALFNNAAQAWNHLFYFFTFSPNGGGAPTGELLAAINNQFGSFEEFQKAFEQAGVKLFGSGWVWLSKDGDGQLFITQGANATNPLSQGLTPLLCFDVWEHAYYLDYQNRRADALHNLWKIIDWEVVARRFKEEAL